MNPKPYTLNSKGAQTIAAHTAGGAAAEVPPKPLTPNPKSLPFNPKP